MENKKIKTKAKLRSVSIPKKVDILVKGYKICELDNERDIIAKELTELFHPFKDLKEKIEYLKEALIEKEAGVFLIASVIYPDKNIKEAITMLYDEIKKIIKNKKDKEKILKYVRLDVDDDISNIYVKATYIKVAIKSAVECGVFK